MRTKNYIFAISIPILLGAGIIALFLLYRSNVEMQLSIQKERLVYQPGYLQSQLFLTELNDRFETLNAFGLELSALPADVLAARLAAGAAETNFSQLAVVGPDGVLARPDGTTVIVSAEPFFINAMAGKRRIEAFSLDGVPGFAFALPFTDAAGRQVLIGFLSEDDLIELLNRSGGQLFKSLLFDRSGQIIAGSSQIPLFSDQKNVFTAFSALEQKGVLPAGAAKELDGAVSGYPDDEETDDRCISSGDGYYTCHPTGINNWYILNYVRSDYVNLSARHTTRQAEFTGGLVLLTALLALTIVTLLHRQRLTVAAEHRGRGIAYTVDALTELYNKFGFEKRTAEALAKAPPRRSAPSSPSRSSPSAPSTRSTASTPETTCCARSRSSCAATCARATPPVGSTPTILPGISAATRRRTSMRRCANASAPPRTAVCRFPSAPAFMRSRTAP